MRLLPLLLLLAACTEPRGDDDKPTDSDPCAPVVRYADTDGDGFGDPAAAEEGCAPPGVEDATDCDDADAAVHPGAPETCDDRDEDCDGTVDEDALDGRDWFADTDADGFGDPTTTVTACDAPADHVGDATDCDDADPDVRPGALECRNGVDDDCDGTIDDDAREPDTWHADADGDGFGDPDAVVSDCAPPEGHVVDGTDCDDADPGAYPGAVASWHNGPDGDCDGVPDELTTASADAVLLGANAADYAGYALDGAGDVDGDGYDDLIVGAWGGDDGGDRAGTAYVVRGPISGDGELGHAEAVLLGESASDFAGWSVAGAGDVDADGHADVALGARLAGDDGEGAVYLLHGPLSGTPELQDAEAILDGGGSGEGLGYALAGGVDLDGDALPDVLAGAVNASFGGEYSGAAYLLPGTSDRRHTTASAAARLDGEDSGDYAGVALAVADVDGDGVGDALVGAQRDDDGGTDAGAAYVVYGPLAGTLDLALADAKLVGEGARDYAGNAVEAADLDGDGTADVLVGATGAGVGGRVYRVSAPAGVSSLAGADAILDATQPGASLGSDVAAVGDVDGDGTADVLVSAMYHGATAAGAAWLLPAPRAGTLAWGETGAVLLPGAGDDGILAVAAAGDTDGDARPDFLVGAYAATGGGVGSGAVYLFRGR